MKRAIEVLRGERTRTEIVQPPDAVPVAELDRAIAILEAAPELIELLRAARAWKRLRYDTSQVGGPNLYTMSSDEYDALYVLAAALPKHLDDPRILALMEKLG